MKAFIDIEHKIHDENTHRLERIFKALIAKKHCPQWFYGRWHEDFDFEIEGFKAHSFINKCLI